jgi:DUF4097 and DUF4098 domain-containing protein YvlB
MKPRVVAVRRDPGERVRSIILTALWLALLALAVAAALTMTPLLSLAAPAPAVSAAAAERYTVAGDRFAVYDLAGHVEVVAGTGPDLVVEVRRGGRDAARLRIETGPIEGRGTLRVITPGDRIVYREGRSQTSGIRVRKDGTFGDRDADPFARRVTVSNRGSGTEAWADLRVLVPRGRAIEVRLGVGAVDAADLGGEVVLDTHAGAVRAMGIRGSLRVDTGAGSVDVRDVTGDLSIDTGSGAVSLVDVTGDDVRVDTGSGGVTARRVTARDVLVDTGSGHVTLEEVRAPRVKVDTGSGGVTLGLADDVDNVLVDTGSGGVTLHVPATLGAILEVDTGSGGIDSDVPMQLLHKERGELRARIGDGAGTIRVDTGSGGVRIVRR